MSLVSLRRSSDRRRFCLQLDLFLDAGLFLGVELVRCSRKEVLPE